MTEESLFTEALDVRDPAERAAFLGRVCAGDAGLRGRVEQLLDQHGRVGSFLGRPAVGPPATGAFTPDGQATQTVTPAEPASAAGTVIGPYKLLQQIGEGGMGTVFMAEQTRPVRRQVALKLIKPGMDSRQVIARFEAERQALALMDHVNIARVFDAGTTEAGRPYFVMELVHGVPITRYCDDNHLTPRERLELFVPVCQAIQHAHQKGVIHRDIKPSNVMVTLYDGKPVPKVIDFGVAKATEQKLTDRTLFTQYGTMVGTLEYMSPEQAETSALGVDTRSDIFSLGVLLYELLTGSTPLTRKRLKEAAYGEVLRLIREEDPPRPSTRLSDSGEALASISAQRHMEPAKLARLVRGELDWIVMKCLEKDRTRRYETANGFAADVRRYLADEPVQACPPSTSYRFRKFARRNRRVLATTAVLVLALVVGTVASTWQAVRATRAEGLADDRLAAETEAQRATREQLVLTQTAEARATRQLFDARLARARAGYLSRRAGQRFDSLDAVREATDLARELKLPAESLLDLRNAAVACLALPDLRLGKQWPWPADARFADFDGRLEYYARTDGRRVVSVRRVADDTEVAALPTAGPTPWALFTRDGKYLSVHSAAGLQVWQMDGPRPVAALGLVAGVVRTFDVHSAGRLCVVALADGTITLHDLATAGPPRRLPAVGPVASLVIHPAGRTVAVGCAAGAEVRDLDTGAVATTLPLPDGAVNLAWHPDGTTLAVLGADARIHLWAPAAAKPPLVIDGLRGAGVHLAFNTAGTVLATVGWEAKLRLWDPRTGRQLLDTTSLAIGPPRFNPDDRRMTLDIRDGRMGMWEVAEGREYQTLVRTPVPMQGPDYHATVHRDGRLLAVGMTGGVGLWDLAGGRELAFFPSAEINSAWFEPSGALLINGPAGLVRWPVRTEPGPPDLVRVGPPQKLAAPGSIFTLAGDADGRVIASAQYWGGVALHADRPDRPVRLAPHHDARYAAVSPDGKLVATSSHSNSGVRVWSAAGGPPLKVLPAVGWGRVQFSPDGKWLGTSAPGCRLWEVGSWREGPKIGGGGMGAAFSPDSTLLAVETGYGVIRLVDPGTGREYARLEDPHQDRAGCIRFTPDGARLVATADDSQSVHVWDLRLIRRQLAEMGLDWDLPPYPPAGPAAGPLKVEVDLGEPEPDKKGGP